MVRSLSSRCFISWTFSALAAWGALAGAAAAQSAAPGAPSAERFRAEAAADLGVPVAEVTLGDLEGPVVLADLGLRVWVASGTLGDAAKTVVALDAHGNRVDLDLAVQLDRAAAVARRGTLGARLAEVLVQRPLDEALAMVVWLDAPSPEGMRQSHARRVQELDARGELTREAADALHAELAAGVRALLDPVTAAAAARFQAAGLQVIDRDVYAPIVFLRALPEQLAAIVDDPAVLSIDWAGEEYQDRLSVATAEVRANSAWSAPGGVTGAGAKVSIVESGRVCSSNPYLTVAATKTPAGAVSSHTTGVGSCVASTHPTQRGVAPGATLISANGADFTSNTTNVTTQMPGSVSAVSWSVSQGAHIMNLSYGAGNPGATVSSFDRYLDYVARFSARSMVIACGNSGNYAGDPGAGFNQIAVGNFNDAGSSAWSGETMAASSSWNNPSTGVETPQVAGPGTSIAMLTCASPWTGYNASGTSFSSPITAGACALVVSKQPVLGGWPEPVRAILMATAWHNIEGAARLSSRDGAGGIDALAAFRVAARGTAGGYSYGTLTNASFNGSGYYTAMTGSASAGQTVRVCLSWDSTPSGGPTYSTDALLADLDLYVYNPNGTLAASSTSGIQPFEVVHFTAGATGTYTVRIRRYSFNGSSEYFGCAFSTSADQ